MLSEICREVDRQSLADEAPKKFAKRLVRKRVISRFHSKHILAGRSRGFFAGNYRILEMLAGGGMGKVFLAEHMRLKRVVAIKTLLRGSMNNQNLMSRFEREARIFGRISHPNIVQAFDFDEIDGIPMLVMEYIEGIDGQRFLEKFDRLDYGLAVECICQMAEALQHAHDNGVIHRDVKPSNLLLTVDGSVKLLDLGLATCARDRDDGLSQGQIQIGTVDYTAPEQAVDSRKVDARADIYAMGATLYSSITGELPFPNRSAAEKLLAHQTMQPEPIANCVEDVPSEIHDSITAMMAKKPDERPVSTQEVIDMLEPFRHMDVPTFDASAIRFSMENMRKLMDRGPSIDEYDFHKQEPEAHEKAAAAVVRDEDTSDIKTEKTIEPKLQPKHDEPKTTPENVAEKLTTTRYEVDVDAAFIQRMNEIEAAKKKKNQAVTKVRRSKTRQWSFGRRTDRNAMLATIGIVLATLTIGVVIWTSQSSDVDNAAIKPKKNDLAQQADDRRRKS